MAIERSRWLIRLIQYKRRLVTFLTVERSFI